MKSTLTKNIAISSYDQLAFFPGKPCVGDADMKTLYIVSYSRVYKLRTNMEGYVNYL